MGETRNFIIILSVFMQEHDPIKLLTMNSGEGHLLLDAQEQRQSQNKLVHGDSTKPGALQRYCVCHSRALLFEFETWLALSDSLARIWPFGRHGHPGTAKVACAHEETRMISSHGCAQRFEQQQRSGIQQVKSEKNNP